VGARDVGKATEKSLKVIPDCGSWRCWQGNGKILVEHEK